MNKAPRSAVALVATVLSLGVATAIGEAARSPAEVIPMWLKGPFSVYLPETDAREALHIGVFDKATPDVCEMDDDYYMLIVRAGELGEEKLAETSFCSTYTFRLALVDVTGDGIEEFLLLKGEGRGTNVRSEKLVVWTREGVSFRTILEVPFSGFFGLMKTYWTEPCFADLNSDGTTDIRLVLHHGPIDLSRGDYPDLIPEFAVREYVFDPDTGTMKIHRTIRRGEGTDHK